MVAGLSLAAIESASAQMPSVGSADPGRDQRTLTMVVGEQTSIPSQNVRSYSEGAPGVVDVRLPKDGTQFVIVALKPGDTTLLLIMNDGRQVQYKIRVTRSKGDSGHAVQAVDNIRLDFYFVQLSETYSHQIGVGWPGTIGGTATMNVSYDLKANALQEATAGVANQVLPRLDVAQNNGWARVLKQSAVITANGNEASFTSGGENNFQIQGALVAEIRKIAFGTNVHILPRYDVETGRIELSVRADVSELTTTQGTPIPGRIVSTLETVVNLELGQSLVLAGLSSENNLNDKTGLPGLSQIPILGLLFGSHQRKDEHVENLIFIVPTVIDAVPMQMRNRVTEAVNLYHNYSGSVPNQRLIGQPLWQKVTKTRR